MLADTFDKKLDIVFLDFDDINNPLLAAGQAHATFGVARHLVRFGHKVTVICSRFPGSQDGENEGIYYKHIGLGSGNIRLNNAIFFFALPFAVRKLRSDVIVECFTAPISTCFSPLFTQIPVIGMPTMFEAEEFAKKYHLPFHWIERFGSRLYKYFLAYSPLNKAKMERLNPKIFSRIIPNGVDEDFFEFPASESDYAVFIGRIDIVQKGLDLLLDAVELAGDNLKTQIVIIGNGPKEEERKLTQLIQVKKLEAKVKFLGRADGRRKMQLLANAVFGIYPSRFEDFPLVPLELAALSKPLVCFDIPGLAWVPREVSRKAIAFDTRSLAEALIKMSSDQEFRKNCQLAARPFARAYGWESIAHEYEKFFGEVINLEKVRST